MFNAKNASIVLNDMNKCFDAITRHKQILKQDATLMMQITFTCISNETLIGYQRKTIK